MSLVRPTYLDWRLEQYKLYKNIRVLDPAHFNETPLISVCQFYVGNAENRLRSVLRSATLYYYTVLDGSPYYRKLKDRLVEIVFILYQKLLMIKVHFQQYRCSYSAKTIRAIQRPYCGLSTDLVISLVSISRRNRVLYSIN